MRQDIHPELHKVSIACSCGNTIETLSTVKDIQLHICSGCHPFYTGKQKIVDTAGRVERFKQRYAKKQTSEKKGPRTVTIKD